MNRLVIIGNGFDLAHGFKTSYKDFINWYWEQRIEELFATDSKVSHDCLCDIILRYDNNTNWGAYLSSHRIFSIGYDEKKHSGIENIHILKSNPELYKVTYSDLLTRILAENGGYPPTQNGDIRSLF